MSDCTNDDLDDKTEKAREVIKTLGDTECKSGENDENGDGGKVAVQPPSAKVVDLSLGLAKVGNRGNNGGLEQPFPVRYPSDVTDIDPEETEIYLIGTQTGQITRIGKDFSSIANPKLEQLVLRSHLIESMEGLENFSCLELLELYDNQVTELSCLDDGENGAPGRTLRVLDMSFNFIRDMSPVARCENLQELYLANNKLKSIEGLKGLKSLRKIDLGSNKIRVMDEEEFSSLENLEELWLGKNKIEEIRGLENLSKLRRLDVQCNRLTSIENLASQTETLEELYLAQNGITTEGASAATGLAQNFPNLMVLDLTGNCLTSTKPFSHLTALTELWLSGNKIESFEDAQSLTSLGENLETIYLEHNPLQNDPLYSKRLAELIPSVKQIDANLIGGLASLGFSTPVTGGVAETEQERIRRLQDMIVARAVNESQRTDITSTTE